MKNKDEIYYIPEGSPVAPSKFDKRVLLRNRSRGAVRPDDLKKYLGELPDDTDHGVLLDFEAVVGDEKESGLPGGTTH